MTLDRQTTLLAQQASTWLCKDYAKTYICNGLIELDLVQLEEACLDSVINLEHLS